LRSGVIQVFRLMPSFVGVYKLRSVLFCILSYIIFKIHDSQAGSRKGYVLPAVQNSKICTHSEASLLVSSFAPIPVAR
jgi:hypothetical protein